MIKTALTIAGSDPTGGAGIQADLRVFHHLGVYGLSVVSALTAQNTYEVKSVRGVDSSFLEEQLEILISDIRPDALKTGMLFSSDTVKTVARIVKGFDLQSLVIDPVVMSSTGASLIEDGMIDRMKDELFPLARVITPNISEASILSGISIKSRGDMEMAAARLIQCGVREVIITGGHFEEIRDYRRGDEKKQEKTMDLVCDGENVHWLEGEKIKGEYHGTGCAYSAALTALFARGLSLLPAAEKAKEFVAYSIKNAHNIGKGMGLLHIA